MPRASSIMADSDSSNEEHGSSHHIIGMLFFDVKRAHQGCIALRARIKKKSQNYFKIDVVGYWKNAEWCRQRNCY